MQLYNQIAFMENEDLYNYLKENSEYFKYFNRDAIDIKTFENRMNKKYKKRASDKINNALEKIEMIDTMLDILK